MGSWVRRVCLPLSQAVFGILQPPIKHRVAAVPDIYINMQTSSTFSGAGWSITASTRRPNASIWLFLGQQDKHVPVVITEEFYQSAPLPVQNAHQLELISANTNGVYALANSIDLAPTIANAADIFGPNGFAPIGYGTSTFSGGLYTGSGSFTGYFDGQIIKSKT